LRPTVNKHVREFAQGVADLEVGYILPNWVRCRCLDVAHRIVGCRESNIKALAVPSERLHQPAIAGAERAPRPGGGADFP